MYISWLAKKIGIGHVEEANKCNTDIDRSYQQLPPSQHDCDFPFLIEHTPLHLMISSSEPAPMDMKPSRCTV